MTSNKPTTVEKVKETVKTVGQDIKHTVKTGAQKVQNEMNKNDVPDPQKDLDTPVKHQHDIINKQIENEDLKDDLKHKDKNVKIEEAPQKTTTEKVKEKVEQVKENIKDKIDDFDEVEIADPKKDLSTPMQHQHDLINKQVEQEVPKQPTTTSNTKTTMDMVKDTVTAGVKMVKDTVNVGLQKMSNKTTNYHEPKKELDTPVKQQHDLVTNEIDTQVDKKESEPKEEHLFTKTFKKMISKIYSNRKSKDTVFITGCSRGIGLELVSHFLSRNYFVISSCRNPSTAKKLNEIQEKYKSECIVLQLDVSSTLSIDNCVNTMKEIGIKNINILINNAGIMTHNETLLKFNKTEMMRQYQINGIAPCEIFEKFYNSFLKSTKNCKIINMSTILSSINFIGKDKEFDKFQTPGYRMSKTALNMYTKLQANTYSKNEGDPIFIALHPGWVDTSLGSNDGQFKPNVKVQDCAKDITIFILDTLNKINQSGKFYDRNGKELQW